MPQNKKPYRPHGANGEYRDFNRKHYTPEARNHDLDTYRGGRPSFTEKRYPHSDLVTEPESSAHANESYHMDHTSNNSFVRGRQNNRYSRDRDYFPSRKVNGLYEPRHYPQEGRVPFETNPQENSNMSGTGPFEHPGQYRYPEHSYYEEHYAPQRAQSQSNQREYPSRPPNHFPSQKFTSSQDYPQETEHYESQREHAISNSADPYWRQNDLENVSTREGICIKGSYQSKTSLSQDKFYEKSIHSNHKDPYQKPQPSRHATPGGSYLEYSSPFPSKLDAPEPSQASYEESPSPCHLSQSSTTTKAPRSFANSNPELEYSNINKSSASFQKDENIPLDTFNSSSDRMLPGSISFVNNRRISFKNSSQKNKTYDQTNANNFRENPREPLNGFTRPPDNYLEYPVSYNREASEVPDEISNEQQFWDDGFIYASSFLLGELPSEIREAVLPTIRSKFPRFFLENGELRPLGLSIGLGSKENSIIEEDDNPIEGDLDFQEATYSGNEPDNSVSFKKANAGLSAPLEESFEASQVAPETGYTEELDEASKQTESEDELYTLGPLPENFDLSDVNELFVKLLKLDGDAQVVVPNCEFPLMKRIIHLGKEYILQYRSRYTPFRRTIFFKNHNSRIPSTPLVAQAIINAPLHKSLNYRFLNDLAETGVSNWSESVSRLPGVFRDMESEPKKRFDTDYSRPSKFARRRYER